ncbi:MAG TPA: hypothetical protein VH413_17605 [Verrucomicrobiae bacterium]|jgi:hypothetical protein|nr:hypothetical protein [Verrucomicrobiae bacterium]
MKNVAAPLKHRDQWVNSNRNRLDDSDRVPQGYERTARQLHEVKRHMLKRLSFLFKEQAQPCFPKDLHKQ